MLSQKGFTLLELVVVLLVVAILSVFVAQKIGNVTNMKAAAFVKKLRADIRYAQSVAMTTNRRTRVYFNGAGIAPVFAPAPDGYAVAVDGSDDTSCAPLAAPCCNYFSPVQSPDRGGDLAVTLGADIYAGITVTTAPVVVNACLEYDSLGTPYDCSADFTICSVSAAGMTITVPAAAAAVNTVTVAAGTGAVN